MIEIGDWFFDGDDADVSMVISHLSDHFSVPETLGGEIDQPVFRTPQGTRWPKRIEFRSLGRNGNRRVGAPIIGGFLLVQRGQGENGTRYTMRFHLTLNPTRFLVHQVPRREHVVSSTAVLSVSPVSLLTRRLSEHEEVSLHDDNVLIGVRSAVMARPAVWPLWLEAYVVAVLRSLHETMIDAFRTAISAPLRHSHRYSVTEVESYWEFQSVDPIRTIHDLSPAFMSFADSAGVRFYPSLPDESGVSHNSPVLTVSVGTGRIIKAYAKATKRIRLEVEQDLREVTSFGPHTTANAVEMLGMVLRATEMGAADLNALLRHLDHSLSSGEGEQAPPYALVAAVIRVAPDQHVHNALLSVLVNNGAISLPSRSQFRPAVDALARSGDLERTRPNGRTFRLAAKYAEARNVLRAHHPVNR